MNARQFRLHFLQNAKNAVDDYGKNLQHVELYPAIPAHRC